MTPDMPAERIEEEASRWAARLRSGAMQDADYTALDAWLESDPQHRWVLGRYRELAAQLDQRLGTAADSIAVTQAIAGRQRRRLLAGALAAAAGLALTWAVLRHRPDELSTRIAERHVAVLPDGSQVELNAQTVLDVDYRPAERRVRLRRGEALFTVSKDAARPFVVETPEGVVRVTGTVFNVRRTTKKVEVTVLEGTVRLRAASAEVGDEAVARGGRAVMAGDAITVRELPAAEVQDTVAWRQGQAIFDDTRLGEAVERFAAYRAQPLTVDATVADLRIGGRYSLSDLDGLLRTVERVLPVRVVRETDGTVRIVAARPPAP
jgi:transmembrane sensor